MGVVGIEERWVWRGRRTDKPKGSNGALDQVLGAGSCRWQMSCSCSERAGRRYESRGSIAGLHEWRS